MRVIGQTQVAWNLTDPAAHTFRNHGNSYTSWE